MLTSATLLLLGFCAIIAFGPVVLTWVHVPVDPKVASSKKLDASHNCKSLPAFAGVKTSSVVSAEVVGQLESPAIVHRKV